MRAHSLETILESQLPQSVESHAASTDPGWT